MWFCFCRYKGVEADGTTKCFLRGVSLLFPLLRDVGVISGGFRDEELQVFEWSAETGVSGVTPEKCSESESGCGERIGDEVGRDYLG